MARNRERFLSCCAVLATAPSSLGGCALHIGAASSVIQAPEPIELGAAGSEMSAALRFYELGYQVQVPFARILTGASVVTGDAHMRETTAGDPSVVRSDSVTAWHAGVGLAAPVVEVKGLRLAPYAYTSRRLMIPDELSVGRTTELGLQLIPREPWGSLGGDMRQGFAARVGMCWASGMIEDAEYGNPDFAGRGLLFALDYRLLFGEVDKWR